MTAMSNPSDRFTANEKGISLKMDGDKGSAELLRSFFGMKSQLLICSKPRPASSSSTPRPTATLPDCCTKFILKSTSNDSSYMFVSMQLSLSLTLLKLCEHKFPLLLYTIVLDYLHRKTNAQRWPNAAGFHVCRYMEYVRAVFDNLPGTVYHRIHVQSCLVLSSKHLQTVYIALV